MQYFDKNGVEIKGGMTLRMADGSEELVYDTTDAYGNPDLGINASNEEFLERHPYGKPVNRCFTDLTAEEQEEFLSRLGEEGAKRLCLILAESLRTVGDQLDLYAEDNE